MKERKKTWHDWVISHWVEVCALLISVVAMLCTVCNNNVVRELEEKSLKYNYRPLLNVINSYENPLLHLHAENASIQSDGPHVSLIIDSLNVNFTYQNNGNTIAKLRAILFADTTFGGNIIRNRLLSGEVVLDENEYNFFYNSHDILPGNQLDFEYDTYQVRMIENNILVMHLLLLYENENGDLFDTYYIARYVFRESQKPGHFIYMILRQREQTIAESKGMALEFLDENETFFMYTEKQKESILGTLP